MTEVHFCVKRTGENALRVTVSGALDAVAMEAALQALTLEMEGMEHGDMLLIDEGAEWPSIGAIGVELRHWPQLLVMMKQLDRVALVTRNSLFRTAATIESALIPGYEIRSFDDESAATRWLTEAAATD